MTGRPGGADRPRPARVRAPLAGHSHMGEPLLLFHPERAQDRSRHPLQGLVQYGPYSQGLIDRVRDPLRVATIVPAGELAQVDRLLAELERRHQPAERRQYLVPFPGFTRVFRSRVLSAAPVARLELPAPLDAELERAARPHLVLAERLTQAINHLEQHRFEFDVLMIYLPERWLAAFWGPEGEDFDLHDYLKAVTAQQRLPMQIVREDRALRYPCRCSVAWRLGIALYTKAGGIPWKLVPTDTGTAYIGLSYALRPQIADRANGGLASPQFVTCCSQVFDADGTGLEFVAYSPDQVDLTIDRGENPFLSRNAMQRVMARSLALYQRRHGGAPPSRVVVHKTTEFKAEEIDGCFDILRAVDNIELLQVQQDTAWRGVLIEEPTQGQRRGTPGRYPLMRGSYLPLSGVELLLWTQGDAPDAVEQGHFFKEGKGIPAPLLLRRFAGHGGWDQAVRETLGLTKMDWNTDSLYDRLPVTIGFAQTLARVVKRLERLSADPFQFRFFM
jgi:hypothetical protein